MIRLLALIASLSNPPAHRPAGWLRQELLENVGGYADGEAGARQFNRDLQAIEELGKTVLQTQIDRNNTLAYKIEIADQQYLTAAEAEVVAGLVANTDNPILQQLRVRLAIGLPTHCDHDSLARLSVPIPRNIEIAVNALSNLSVLHFRYRGLGDAHARERKVEPYRIYDENGIWYFAGRDRSDGQVKYFRFDRCEGQLQAVGKNRFPRPQTAIAGICESPEAVTPIVAYLPSSAEQIAQLGGSDVSQSQFHAQLPRELGADWQLAQLPAKHAEIWKRQLLGCGTSLVVLAPAQLRAQMCQQLQQLERQLAAQMPEESGDE